MKISVSIPTVRPKTLGSAIASIQRQTVKDWELIVVGQGRDPDIQRVGKSYEEQDSRIRYVHLDKMGISGARNAGIKEARGDIIAFTDDDCEASENWLESLIKCFEEDPKVGLVGGALLAPKVHQHLLAVCPEIHPTEVTYDPIESPRNAPSGFDFTGANFALRREVALRVGDFDELMGVGALLASAEDLDYKFRLEAVGVRMRSTPSVVVYHTHGCRRGVKAVFRHRRSYAIGQGALAAKMTMQGDPRGEGWLKMVWEECTGTLKGGKPQRFPNALVRYLYVRKAYIDCLRHHRIDDAGLFRPISS